MAVADPPILEVTPELVNLEVTPELVDQLKEALQLRRALRLEARLAALEFVNQMREQLGLSPLDALLPGQRKAPGHCPIANSIRHGSSLDVSVLATSALINDQRYAFPSYCVTRFVGEFDRGYYSALVEGV